MKVNTHIFFWLPLCLILCGWTLWAAASPTKTWPLPAEVDFFAAAETSLPKNPLTGWIIAANEKEGSSPTPTLPTEAADSTTDTTNNTCSPPSSQNQENPDKKVWCFFSLNKNTESKALNQAKADKADNLEIKEFYIDSETGAGTKKSVTEAFKEMTTKTQCDALTLSGHHVGYFTGLDSTTQEKSKRTLDQAALHLSFLEDLACEGDECKEWFSDIKVLFLHGSRTAGVQAQPAPLAENSTDKAAQDPEVQQRNQMTHLTDPKDSRFLENWMREYASTVDENNPLHSRYLKMFPQAQVMAFGGRAARVDASAQDFIQYITNLEDEGDPTSPSEQDFQNFLDYVQNPSPTSDFCTQSENAWTGLPQGQAFRQSQDSEKARQMGCDFSDALKSNNSADIQQALAPILDNPQYIHQNLNRIFHALNDDSPLSPESKNTILEALRNSPQAHNVFTENIQNSKLGVVRRADYLHLYKRISGTPPPENLWNQYTSLENQWTDNIIEQYKNSSDIFKALLAEVIWKNNLGSQSPEQVKTLIEKFAAESHPHLQKQSLLLGASAELFQENIITDEQIKTIIQAVADADPNSAGVLVRDLAQRTKGENSLQADDRKDILDIYTAATKDSPNPNLDLIFSSGILTHLHDSCQQPPCQAFPFDQWKYNAAHKDLYRNVVWSWYSTRGNQDLTSAQKQRQMEQDLDRLREEGDREEEEQILQQFIRHLSSQTTTTA